MNPFNVIAPFYNSFMKMSGLFKVQEVLACFQSVQGARIADLGGGTGVYSATFAERGAKVTLVDASAQMLRRAPKHPSLTMCRASLTKIPLPDETFDIVLLIDVLHHVPHISPVLTEATRLLRPHGKLLILEIPYQNSCVAIARRFWEYFITPRAQFLSPKAWHESLAKQGLTCERFELHSTYFIYVGVKNVW